MPPPLIVSDPSDESEVTPVNGVKLVAEGKTSRIADCPGATEA